MTRRGALSTLGLAALELAQEYGFAVFPVHWSIAGACSCAHGATCERIAKHPRNHDGFKGASLSAEQIAAWWTRWPDANIGLYPGASQLLVIDVDGPAGEAAARALGAYDVDTLEVVTRRGVHRYFRLPRHTVVPNVPGEQSDIRAHGGYVLAPPSVHASGHVYAWRGSLDDVANIPDRFLAALQQRIASGIPSAEATAHVTELRQRRHDETFAALVAAGRRQGLSNDFIVASLDRWIKNYLARVGWRAKGDGRNNAAFRIAARLLHGFALSETIAAAYVNEWNMGNTPPLSERELATTFRSAQRHGARQRA